MKKLSLFLVLIMAATLVLSACNSAPAATSTTAANTTATATTPAPSTTNAPTFAAAQASGSGRTDLNLTVAEAFITFDPIYQNLIVDTGVCVQMFETLYFTDDAAESHPMLAEDYSVSDDGLIYTFNLRKGVKFHNGDEMKADDVVFSVLEAMKSPYRYSAVEPIKDCVKVDDYTVEIHMKNLYAPFFTSLNSIWIVNKKAYEAAGSSVAFGESPVGTGPYKFESQQKNVSAVITRFEDYWGPAASIEKISWKVITDMSTAVIAFEAGEIDILDVPSANWESIKAADKWITVDMPYTHICYMVYNHEVEPFNNKLVRQAVNYAINKEDIIIIARDGLAEPAYTAAKFPYVLGATYDVPTYDYDPDKAMELLTEAGYGDGFDIGAILALSGTYFEKVAQVVQSNLADVGITATIELRESATYQTDISAGNFSMAVNGRTTSPDFSYFDVFYDSAQIGAGNGARFNNERVDELFALGKSTLDKDERIGYYNELIDIVQEDATYAPVFFRTLPTAYDKALTYTRYLNYIFYKDCSWN